MNSFTVITGASRGIGACFAQHLARSGHALILAARSASELDVMAAGLKDLGASDVRCVPCDLSVAAGVPTLAAVCQPLRISGVINNAGFGLGGDFAGQNLLTIESMLYLNIQSLTQLTHTLLPKIKKSGALLSMWPRTPLFSPFPSCQRTLPAKRTFCTSQKVCIKIFCLTACGFKRCVPRRRVHLF